MRPRLKVNLQIAVEGAGLPTKAQFKRWAEAAAQVKNRPIEISVRIVDALEGRELNRTYRGKDYATNVLTFTYDELPDIPGLPLIGDLVFCHEIVTAEAIDQGKALEAHYAHLTVHGALHLQGYDHQEDEDAEAMESLETRILAGLRYPDPYASEKEDV